MLADRTNPAGTTPAAMISAVTTVGAEMQAVITSQRGSVALRASIVVDRGGLRGR